MYAGLKRPRGSSAGWYRHMMESDDDCVLRLYVEAMGHEPPAPSSPAAALQFRYGIKDCRTKAMKQAILSGATAPARELVAA